MDLNGASDVSDTRSAAIEARDEATPTADQSREQEVRTELANNARALEALDGLVADRNYGQLTAEQKVQTLNAFLDAPNAATAAYLQGQAATTLNPEIVSSALTPDSGTLTLGGQTYSIDQGVLSNAQQQRVGNVWNDGTVQMNGQPPSSVYDDIGTRVQFREQVGTRTETTLDLHAADPRGLLANQDLNPHIVDRATAVLGRARREGMDMRVVDGFRSVAAQDALYAQGRTTPGNIVTNARGGSSWHNYGLATDIAFNNANGQPAWPENGNWTRYGEIAVAQGLEWGGNWQGLQDRPHIEYHPGLETGAARNLLNSYRQGGLEAVWDRLGIGRQP